MPQVVGSRGPTKINPRNLMMTESSVTGVALGTATAVSLVFWFLGASLSHYKSRGNAILYYFLVFNSLTEVHQVSHLLIHTTIMCKAESEMFEH